MYELFRTGKRGMSLSDAPSLIVTLVIIAVVGAVGLITLVSFRSAVDAGNGDATGAINDTVSTLGNFYDLLPVVGTILVAAILIAAVVGGFMYFSRRL